ncbi:MAG: hypothetical protein J6R99_05030 [Alphaproteobacteria bacterium]|nr:hypothetical protein [Alphaproteobacteria bacterium]
MGNVQDFRNAVSKIKAETNTHAQELSYVSDMNNWLCVHATQYMPKKSKDGKMYIPTTAMANNFAKHPRSTVHFTLNHIVTSHGYGSWDGAQIVVLAPYKSIVRLNKNPAEVAAQDTYWSVDPDVGLKLPENTYIVKPDNNVLFHVGENSATYKTDNFTDEEVQQIESMLSPLDKHMYNKYKNAEFEDWEVNQIIQVLPKSVQNFYAVAKDKKAFLRGMFEESKFEMLAKYLRDVVVKMAMEKIGYQQVLFFDADEKSMAVAKTAIANNLSADASNKGHGNSLFAVTEETYYYVNSLLRGGLMQNGLYEQQDLDALYAEILNLKNSVYGKLLVDSIVNNKSIDFYNIYLQSFMNEAKKRVAKGWMKEFKTIAEFDKNLDKTLHKNADVMSKEYLTWLAKIQKFPGYEEFIVKLKQLMSPIQILDAGRDL